MDTLPIVLKEEELKPGDLIFYEGTYYSNRSKPQKHNNVHVEIYLGNGGTIGSRFHRGCVSIFPSYKFTSTTWELVAYHFRSIDTWLDGKCLSCCPEHPWASESLALAAAAGKKSIFYVDSDDENAGGDYDDDADNDNNLENQNVNISNQNSCCDDTKIGSLKADKTLAMDINPKASSSSPKSRTRRRNLSTHLISTNSATSVVESSLKNSFNDDSKILAQSTSVKSLSTQNTYYVNKNNGWKLVKAALDKRGWQQLPFEYNFSTRYSLKWVERRSQIDYKAHQAGQLVCHIPNNDCITTKVNLLNTLKQFYQRDDPNTSVKWLPLTFRLDTPSECLSLIQYENDIKNNSGSDGVWIYKPACNNRGRGIKVVKGKTTLEQICYGDLNNKDDSQYNAIISSSIKGIMQKYIEDPLLVSKENLKFDVRCYLLISRTYPKTLAFYHPGYCRLTLKPYTLDEESLNDNSVHLTNAAIQKKEEGYEVSKEKQVRH